jgi:hypothetical protein
MSLLSLYIPIISEKTSEDYIKSVFVKKNIGKILRVDFVFNIQKNRREAFIHFDEWFKAQESNEFKEDVLNADTNTKLYHTDKRFWPILVNKNPHKRVNNSNYTIIKTNEVKVEFANSLNIITPSRKVSQVTENKKVKST